MNYRERHPLNARSSKRFQVGDLVRVLRLRAGSATTVNWDTVVTVVDEVPVNDEGGEFQLQTLSVECSDAIIFASDCVRREAS
jgi:hypothetical protein